MPVDTITFTPVSTSEARDPLLHRQLLDTWVAVTDAGGAVGFIAPADPELIGAALDAALQRVAAGRDALGILRRDPDGATCAGRGPAVGMGILAASSSPLRRHWRTVLRLMVAPDLQGQGAGRRLMDGLHVMARELNLEFLCLTVRGGLDIEGFYGHLGYEIYGRNSRSIRVAPGDDRDEIHMRCVL